MAIFGFWGEFGGSPGDPPKPPKNPIFANFRWVLNNSPSRDILNSLFGPFWDILKSGHFGGTPRGAILGRFGGYIGGELYRIGWNMVGLGESLYGYADHHPSSCHHYGR